MFRKRSSLDGALCHLDPSTQFIGRMSVVLNLIQAPAKLAVYYLDNYTNNKW